MQSMVAIKNLLLTTYNAGTRTVDKAGGVPDIAETQAYVTKGFIGCR